MNKNESSRGFLEILVGILVVAIVAMVSYGVYFYYKNGKTFGNMGSVINKVYNNSSTTVTPSPSASLSNTDSIDAEFNQSNTDNTNADFKDLDQDINKL